jgi:hypothetical protein
LENLMLLTERCREPLTPLNQASQFSRVGGALVGSDWLLVNFSSSPQFPTAPVAQSAVL